MEGTQKSSKKQSQDGSSVTAKKAPVLAEPLIRRWYVMRTKVPAQEKEYIESVYNKDKTADDVTRFEVFAPKMTTLQTKDGVNNRRTTSVFNNLLFIQARREDIHHYKLERPTLRFYSARIVNNELCYLYVPDRQMRDFMQIARAAEREVRYYTLEEGIFRKGDVVRIIGGVRVNGDNEAISLDGVEGVVKKSGRKSLKVHVALDGLGSVQTWEISPQYVEFLQFADDKSTHSLAYEELERFQPRGMKALNHWMKGNVEDGDRAACQIFLRRLQHARTITPLMQHKLNLSLLVSALVLGEQAAEERFKTLCLEALPELKAQQLRAYTLLVLHLLQPNQDYLEEANTIVKGWKAFRKLTVSQQTLKELLTVAMFENNPK